MVQLHNVAPIRRKRCRLKQHLHMARKIRDASQRANQPAVAQRALPHVAGVLARRARCRMPKESHLALTAQATDAGPGDRHSRQPPCRAQGCTGGRKRFVHEVAHSLASDEAAPELSKSASSTRLHPRPAAFQPQSKGPRKMSSGSRKQRGQHEKDKCQHSKLYLNRALGHIPLTSSY